jgi:6-pyruvoyltetrahydropterin/6-carboxytetrahydropterin synthase
LIFECETLDDKNWGMDFGGLKEFKAWADYMFDHTLVIAQDDPYLEFFRKMSWMGHPPQSGIANHAEVKPHERGAICDLRIVEGVGCEMFAKLCYDKMVELLASGNMRYPINPNVRIKSAEVFEHGANSAIYEG